jgi:hypothetical protein
MEVMVALVVGILLGITIGILIASRKLHKQSNGFLMFDSADKSLAPYLCFESLDDLTEIQNKKFVTLVVGWSKN